MTKMLVPLFILLASSLLSVESAISQGPCDNPGTETTEESWNCNNGDSECTSFVTTCDSNSFGSEVSGTLNFLANGEEFGVGEAWDCRHIIAAIV